MIKYLILLSLYGCGDLIAQDVPKIDIPYFWASCEYKDGTSDEEKYVVLAFDYRNNEKYKSCIIDFEEE